MIFFLFVLKMIFFINSLRINTVVQCVYKHLKDADCVQVIVEWFTF